MAPQGRHGRPQRTKDTCDMCSASKVKCDKEKPVCSRCRRLEYPCFYSPARRIRKQSDTATSEPVHAKHADQQQHEEPKQQQTPQQQQQSSRGSDLFHTDITSMDDGLTTDSNASDDFMFGTGDLLSHNIQEWLPSTSMSNSFPPTLTNDQQPTMPLLSGSASGPASNSGSGSISDSEHCPLDAPDCAATAMDLLQNLDYRRSLQSQSPGSSPSSINVLGELDAVVEECGVAIRRISAVLVCPCSKKADTGLLAAAVCFAMLGVYETFLSPHNSSLFPSNSATNALTNGRQTPSTSNFGTTTAVTTPFSPSSSGMTGIRSKAPIMRILGELPRVADLVTQFRNRYCSSSPTAAGDVDGTEDLFKGMVATMTCRLRNLIDEFTHLLVDS